jgi:hypothetical protein
VSNSSVLSYVTGNRPGVETQVGLDQLVRFRRHLDSIGQVERVTLIVYTSGGDINMPWPLMNFLREHCETVIVAVPYTAHSAGTLLALGADEIVMTRFATLSPIDPTVANAFNPQDPANPANRLAIAVEDVLSFLELAKQHGGPDADGLAFRRLAESVHPLALGNVQRSVNQIRKLAAQMLTLARPDLEDGLVDKIVKSLTTEFYTHGHLINRREAAKLGLAVQAPTEPEFEKLLLDYYTELISDLELLEPFDAPRILRSSPNIPVQVNLARAYIETATTCDSFVTEGVLNLQTIGMPMPPGTVPMMPQLPQQAVSFEITREAWTAEE